MLQKLLNILLFRNLNIQFKYLASSTGVYVITLYGLKNGRILQFLPTVKWVNGLHYIRFTRDIFHYASATHKHVKSKTQPRMNHTNNS